MNETDYNFFDLVSFAPREVCYFRLPVYNHFQKRPYHARTLLGKWNVEQFRQDYGGMVIRSDEYFDAKQEGAVAQLSRRLLAQLGEGLYCHLKEDELVVFAETHEAAVSASQAIAEKYLQTVTTEPQPYFCLIKAGGGSLSVERVEIEGPVLMQEAELEMHYGGEGLQFEQKLLDALQTQKAGATILRGPPGVGKTSLIKHLIAKLRETHRFFYLPLSACRFLAGADMVDFWVSQARENPKLKNIVVLEDAEDLLMERGNDNRSEVAGLLNATDGLLGELLHVHLLCTVNCAMDKIDPAILRPGRLLAYWEFKRLDRAQAHRLAQARGLTIPEQSSYSLAEIYRKPVIGGTAFHQPVIGFAA